jgi:hypothetical protein
MCDRDHTDFAPAIPSYSTKPRFIAEDQASEDAAQEITMSSKPAVFAIQGLMLLAAIALAPALAIRGDDADIMSFSHQASAKSTLSGPPPSGPIIVAQGRCFNGRCY